jgi:hypothetical protein
MVSSLARDLLRELPGPKEIGSPYRQVMPNCAKEPGSLPGDYTSRCSAVRQLGFGVLPNAVSNYAGLWWNPPPA